MLSGIARHLRDGEIAEAHELTRTYELPHGDEIEALIRAGWISDAIERIEKYLNPKYPSVAACESHVGKAHHFSKTNRSLL